MQYDKSEDCTSCRIVSGIVCVCVCVCVYTHITTIYIYTYIHTYMHTPDTFQHLLKAALSSHSDEIISVHILLNNNILNCTQYSGPKLPTI